MIEAHNLQSMLSAWLLPSFLGAVGSFLLGIVWYHPRVLGARWLDARGLQPNDVSRHSSPFVLSFPLWFISALFYTFLAVSMGIEAPAEVFLFSCMLWVAFAMPPIVMGSLYTGYPFNAVAIDASYQLAGYYMLGFVYLMMKSLAI